MLQKAADGTVCHRSLLPTANQIWAHRLDKSAPAWEACLWHGCKVRTRSVLTRHATGLISTSYACSTCQDLQDLESLLPSVFRPYFSQVRSPSFPVPGRASSEITRFAWPTAFIVPQCPRQRHVLHKICRPSRLVRLQRLFGARQVHGERVRVRGAGKCVSLTHQAGICDIRWLWYR
jgi:hypothetical protein